MLLKTEKSIEYIYLFIIFVIALGLRIYNLDKVSLWTDEGLTLQIAANKSFVHVINNVISGQQQPLYFVFINLWTRLFGISEIAIRIPSLIFGLATVFMTYKVSKLLFKSNEAGIISALLISLSTFHIDYSYDARPYTLCAFLSLLSIYFFIKVLEISSFKNMFLYVVFTTLLIYTHSQGAFVALIQGIFTFVNWAIARKKNNYFICLFLQLIVLILFSPWLFNLKHRGAIKDEFFGFWLPEATLLRVLRTFTDYFSGSDITFIIFLFLIVTSMFLSENKKHVYFLVLLFLLPPFMLYIIHNMWKPVYIERYTFCASIPYLILVAAGISELRKYIKVPLLIILILLSSSLWFLSVKKYYETYFPFTYKAINWKEVTRFVEEEAGKDNLIVFDSSFIRYLLYNYYSKRQDLMKTDFSFKVILRASYVTVSSKLTPYLNKANRVWLLEYHNEDKNKFIQKRINEDFKLISETVYNKGQGFEELKIKIYDRKY